MSSCVCAKCKKPWKMSSSPAICPVCNQVSFAIAIPEVSATAKKRGSDAEHRAKISAAIKKCYQDPEYRAKISAAAKKRYQDPEYRAKMSTARARRHKKGGPVFPCETPDTFGKKRGGGFEGLLKKVGLKLMEYRPQLCRKRCEWVFRQALISNMPTAHGVLDRPSMV